MFTIFPELVRSAWSYDEERLAILVHRYFGKGEPLKTRHDFEEMLTKAGIILCYDTSQDTHGCLLIPDDRYQYPVFCIKKDLEWIEQKFLIANLLGHFLFDHQIKLVSGNPKMGMKKETQSPYKRFLECKRPRQSQMEYQMIRLQWLSDEFAGSLLLPKQWLKKFVEHEKEPLLIAAHFSLPLEFLHARIRHIRQRQLVLNEVQGLNRKISLSSKGHSLHP